jgi:hypothetical protein
MFLLYSHHQAYLQSLVEICVLNAYAMWDPSSEPKKFTGGINMVFVFNSICKRFCLATGIPHSVRI